MQSELYSRGLTVQGRRQTCKHHSQKEKQDATAAVWARFRSRERSRLIPREISLPKELKSSWGEGRGNTGNRDPPWTDATVLGCFCERQQLIHRLTPLTPHRIVWPQPSKDITNSGHYKMVNSILNAHASAHKSCVSPASSWKVISTLQV